MRSEESQRVSALDDESLILCELLEVLDDEAILEPVLAHLTCLTISDKLIRVECYGV